MIPEAGARLLDKRDRAPELMRGSQGSGRDRPASEGTLDRSLIFPIGIKTFTPYAGDGDTAEDQGQRSAGPQCERLVE